MPTASARQSIAQLNAMPKAMFRTSATSAGPMPAWTWNPGRKGFGTGTFESVMVTLAVITIGFGIAALIAETTWWLLVPMVAGLVLMWALALMHDAGYVAPTHAVGHA